MDAVRDYLTKILGIQCLFLFHLGTENVGTLPYTNLAADNKQY